MTHTDFKDWPALAANLIPAIKQLWDFQRVEVEAGGQGEIDFVLSAANFQTADVSTGDIVVYPGTYAVTFTDGAGFELSATVRLTGQVQVVERFPTVA